MFLCIDTSIAQWDWCWLTEFAKDGVNASVMQLWKVTYSGSVVSIDAEETWLWKSQRLQLDWLCKIEVWLMWQNYVPPQKGVMAVSLLFCNHANDTIMTVLRDCYKKNLTFLLINNMWSIIIFKYPVLLPGVDNEI